MRATLAVLMLTALLAAADLCAGAQAQPRRDGHGSTPLDEYNRALGVECTHCHVDGEWQDDSKPPKATARKMSEMVALLNGKQLRGVGEVRCWTCHAGQTQPARLPKQAMDAQIAKWPAGIADAGDDVKLRMAVYSASTGLRCTQCHETDNWKRYATDRMRMVPRMNGLFPAMQPFMPPGAVTQCYMCHKGQNKPEKNP